VAAAGVAVEDDQDLARPALDADDVRQRRGELRRALRGINETVDAVVIGGGAAGLSGGLMLARSRARSS
jgi:hypothetical protein